MNTRRAGSSAADLESAAAAVGRALRQRGETLALAESCTGGLIAASLTAVAGASEFLWGAAVVYTPAAKLELVRLDEAALQTHGSVSAATSEALAAAVRKRSGATYGVAVTGWAGPTAAPGEEVGRVFGALAGATTVQSQAWLFDGDRNQVRRRAALSVLDLLRRHLGREQDVEKGSTPASGPVGGAAGE